MNIFSKRLKELRQSKGLTLKDVSGALGLSLMAYAHYEHGDRQPSIDTIRKICEFFAVSSDFLIGLSDDY